MRPVASSRARCSTARAGKANSSVGSNREHCMRRRTLRVFCAIALCAQLGACQTGGNPRLGETRSEKEQDAVDTRVALGRAYMQQGKYELAQENLLKALDRNPNSVDAHTVLAVLYEHLGNPKAAEQHYARAADLAP